MSAELQSEIDILKSVLRSDEEQLRIEKDKTMGAVKMAMDYLAECDVLRERVQLLEDVTRERDELKQRLEALESKE